MFRFLQGEGRSEDDSRELTQEFFARLLGGNGIDGAEYGKGRFRSYLLGALKHFLAELRRNAGRQKRGGGVSVESIESSVGEMAGTSVPAPSDKDFDREWAMELMDRALAKVRQTFVDSGKERQFSVLKPMLIGETADSSQSDAATELGISHGSVRVILHRMRKSFGEAVREEISQTVNEPEEVAAELRYLIEVLS